jgi:hypothetical protein
MNERTFSYMEHPKTLQDAIVYFSDKDRAFEPVTELGFKQG